MKFNKNTRKKKENKEAIRKNERTNKQAEITKSGKSLKWWRNKFSDKKITLWRFGLLIFFSQLYYSFLWNVICKNFK